MGRDRQQLRSGRFPPSGHTLTDHDGAGNSNISLPAESLPAGAFLVVHLSAGTNDLDFGDGAGHFYTGNPLSVYDAEDQVALYSSATQNASTLADLVAWDSDGVRSADFNTDVAAAVAAGLWIAGAAADTSSMDPAQSLGRSGDSLRTGAAADWETSGGRDASDPTPGQRNAGGVVVNEVLMSQAPGTPQGLELYNAGSGSVDVTGWMVGDGDGAGIGGLSFVVPQVDGADLVLAPQARVWIELGAGSDSASALYATLADPAALDAAADQVALYFRRRSPPSRASSISWRGTLRRGTSPATGSPTMTSPRRRGLERGGGRRLRGCLLHGPGPFHPRSADGLDTDRSQDWSFSGGVPGGDRDGDGDGVVSSAGQLPRYLQPRPGRPGPGWRGRRLRPRPGRRRLPQPPRLFRLRSRHLVNPGRAGQPPIHRPLQFHLRRRPAGHRLSRLPRHRAGHRPLFLQPLLLPDELRGDIVQRHRSPPPPGPSSTIWRAASDSCGRVRSRLRQRRHPPPQSLSLPPDPPEPRS